MNVSIFVRGGKKSYMLDDFNDKSFSLTDDTDSKKMSEEKLFEALDKLFKENTLSKPSVEQDKITCNSGMYCQYRYQEGSLIECKYEGNCDYKCPHKPGLDAPSIEVIGGLLCEHFAQADKKGIKISPDFDYMKLAQAIHNLYTLKGEGK